MKIGSVADHGDAVVRVRVRGRSGLVATFEGVVVDTGFNGWLTLSQVEVRALDLELREEGRYWLADGSEMVSRLYTAEVEWVGEWRRIMVLEMAGGSLLGMALLRGFHLGIDVVSGGKVEVDPL